MPLLTPLNTLYKALKPSPKSNPKQNTTTEDTKPFASHLESDTCSILSNATTVTVTPTPRGNAPSEKPRPRPRYEPDSMDYGSSRYMSRGMSTRA
ncbi:hypothetical protein BO70DRAFT_359670 [Aspergillus heteromorphus CBS 117.55]|uniref:Uncharacterized protein n=1 Tax=Aspergillus heteromorphus CBS 117.55 TaxID=1448321 RepID=A0A317WSP7_9EURO|nr:uncharacterized protein BO70DRAFT_359670 [Aspergillus heteromorphus CBS 117.55]PWY88197.1 hypothetical protein BO70DRAFT_359670 [Aspergillus heteromorphus CBS 117.55]